MKTNCENLDKIITKLNNSSLNVIAGRPSMGKSTIAFNIAVNMMKKEKISVAIFSLEISKEYICNNFIDSSLVNTQIIIDDTPNISITEIEKRCRKLKAANNVGLVIIDYLQLILVDNETNREQELSTISQRLKKLTEELNIPVLVTSQLSREADIRFKEGQDPKPTLNDFGSSSDIIKYADTIMLLYRDDYYNLNSDKKNVLEINVVKSTNKIADMCEKIKPVSDEKYYLRIKNAEVEIKDLAYKGAHRIYGNSLSIKVQERLDKELKSIIENDYATLYMIAQKIVEKANEDGYIMGFRGAVGSSLVAYYMRYNRN